MLHTFPKLSDLKRSQTITTQRKVPGVAWCTSKSKLAVLYKVRTAISGVEEMFLGTSSNDAAMVKPRMISKDITKSVLVAADKSKVPSSVEMGTDIDKSHAIFKKYFCDNSGTPIDNEINVIARIPVSMLIVREARIQTGKIDQGTFDSVESVETELLPFWLEHIVGFNASFQEDVLKEDSCKGYRPGKPATGHTFAASPFVGYTAIDDDDSDIEEEVNNLSEECKDIMQKSIYRR